MDVESADDDDLETPGDGLISLDRKRVAALTKASAGKLGRKLTLTSNAALSSERAARGRVLLRTASSITHLGRTPS